MTEETNTKRKIIAKAKNSIRFLPSGIVLLCLAFMPASCNKGERSLWEAVVGYIDARAKQP